MREKKKKFTLHNNQVPSFSPHYHYYFSVSFIISLPTVDVMFTSISAVRTDWFLWVFHYDCCFLDAWVAVNEVGASDDRLLPVTDTFFHYRGHQLMEAADSVSAHLNLSDDWKLIPYYSVGYLQMIYNRTKNDANQL